MSKLDLISIVVPVFNVEKYLTKCIESILNQDYENFELILVDDGSTDQSSLICDKYAKNDKRIKVIHNLNSGVSHARNAGINTSSGRYICFIDGDDFVKNDYISYMHRLIKQNNAEIAVCTKLGGNFSQKKETHIAVNVDTGESAVKKILSYRVPIGCYSKMFSADLLKKGNVRFYEDIKIGEGFNFNISCFLKANTVVFSTKQIYYYRRDNNSSAMSSYSADKARNQISSLDRIYLQIKDNYQTFKEEYRFAYWRTISDLYDLLKISGIEDEFIYEGTRHILRTGFIKSLKCNTDIKNKIRAFAFLLNPNIVPIILKKRKIHYGI